MVDSNPAPDDHPKGGPRLTRGRMGRIRQLPKDLREVIDRLLRDGVAQSDIRARLEPLLSERGERPLSAAGLNRYAARMEGIGRRMREAREVAAAWAATHGDRPETELGQTIVQIVQTLAFEVSQKIAAEDMETEELLTSLKDLGLLAQRLERAAELGHRREQELRKTCAAEAEQAAKEQGLSAPTAAAIREAIEGVGA